MMHFHFSCVLGWLSCLDLWVYSFSSPFSILLFFWDSNYIYFRLLENVPQVISSTLLFSSVSFVLQFYEIFLFAMYFSSLIIFFCNVSYAIITSSAVFLFDIVFFISRSLSFVFFFFLIVVKEHKIYHLKQFSVQWHEVHSHCCAVITTIQL